MQVRPRPGWCECWYLMRCLGLGYAKNVGFPASNWSAAHNPAFWLAVIDPWHVWEIRQPWLVAVITSPGQSTVYRAWHPSLLSSESRLYPAQTRLSVVFWRHRASEHPACDWLSVVRKNAALRDQTLLVPGVELIRRTQTYTDLELEKVVFNIPIINM